MVGMGIPRGDKIARTMLIWTVMAVVVATVASCTHVVTGRAVLAGPRIGQPVEWGPCRVAGGGGTSIMKLPGGAQCGKLAVPVDYHHVDGDATTLALIKFPATRNKIGSLIINPGGPGESGIEAALGLLQSLRRGFANGSTWSDSIRAGWRRRGRRSGATPTPTTTGCAPSRRVDYSPAGVAHIEDETKAFVGRCIDKMGKKFLAHVGTVDVARDLDAIREALGDSKLTFLGYSYGTRIGAAYAEAYPKNVRAMILDGAVDPNTNSIEADLRQAKGFQDAFNDFAKDCAKSPSCPLGTDPAKAVGVYHSLVDPLVDKNNPMIGRPARTKDPRGLSYSDAIVGTIMALYSPTFWHHLTEGLTELAHHRGDTLLELADLYMRRDKHGHYTDATDARVAIDCVDDPPVKDRAKVIDEDRRSRQVAPFMSYGKFTGDAPLGTCAFWPVPPTSKPHTISAPGLAPTLVVSTTRDPATPYQAGVDLANQLHGG